MFPPKLTLFLSTPSARRATDRMPLRSKTYLISIHALREEGDSLFSSTSTQTGRISIHALREEGDLDPSQSLRGVRISIHALREEGDLPEKDRQAVRSISIHALREEGDRHPAERRAGLLRISIHALREEGDGKISSIEGEPDNFYPRPPRGGRPAGNAEKVSG